MSHAFVQIGPHWINLDLVTSVELVEDPNQAGVVHAARIHFSTGKHQDYKVAADVQELRDFLRSHKAT